jgi:hypothetical protein
MVSPELSRLLALPEVKQAVDRARADIVAKWAAATDPAERERLWSAYHGIEAGFSALRAIADGAKIEAEREKRRKQGL